MEPNGVSELTKSHDVEPELDHDFPAVTGKSRSCIVHDIKTTRREFSPGVNVSTVKISRIEIVDLLGPTWAPFNVTSPKFASATLISHSSRLPWYMHAIHSDIGDG